VVSAVSAG